VVQSLWRQIPSKFKDYIKSPKRNGYQSLHTVLRDQDGYPIEVQLRTEDMHVAAEFGVAAHWRYKESIAGGKLSVLSSLLFYCVFTCTSLHFHFYYCFMKSALLGSFQVLVGHGDAEDAERRDVFLLVRILSSLTFGRTEKVGRVILSGVELNSQTKKYGRLRSRHGLGITHGANPINLNSFYLKASSHKATSSFPNTSNGQ
jgi:hypothetical protein